MVRKTRRPCRNDRRLHCLYVRLKDAYREVKAPEPGPGSRESYDSMVAKVARIAYWYSREGCRFDVAPGGAAADLFTFLRHPGTGPTDSLAERSLGPSVTVRKARHTLKTEDGMGEFGILMARVVTWRVVTWRVVGRTSAGCSGTCCRAPQVPTRWRGGNLTSPHLKTS